MAVVLLRIDERLIHGQVVVGWAAVLDPDHYVVVDDPLAGSEWEQDLYLLGVPTGTTAEFVTIENARGSLEGWDADDRRIVVLTRGPQEMAALGAGGVLSEREINVGGLHHGPGRHEVLSYVHLTDDEAAALGTLVDSGARVWARDVPGAAGKDLAGVLSGS